MTFPSHRIFPSVSKNNGLVLGGKDNLLSGLIKCGLCGANYIMIARDRYGCSTRRTKGTCSNDHVLERGSLEHLVLNGLKEKLIESGPVEEFIKEFNSQIAARTTADRGERHRTEHELKQVEKNSPPSFPQSSKVLSPRRRERVCSNSRERNQPSKGNSPNRRRSRTRPFIPIWRISIGARLPL